MHNADKRLSGRTTIKLTKRMRYGSSIHASLILLSTPLAAIAVILTNKFIGFEWSYVLFWLVFHFTGALAPTLCLHRFFCHRSFSASSSVSAFLAAFGMTSFQGPLVYWVSNHRHHHSFSDQAGDPHSPIFGSSSVLLGWWRSHMGWMFSSYHPNPHRYARDILKSPQLMMINKLYLIWVVIGLLVPALVGVLMFGGVDGFVLGLVWGGFVRIATVHHATFSINSFGHLFGIQRFDTRDNSRNTWWLSLLTLGESWHNNHHAAPYSARHGLSPKQIDITFLVIRLMSFLGLARNIRVASLDDETWKRSAKEPVSPRLLVSQVIEK